MNTDFELWRPCRDKSLITDIKKPKGVMKVNKKRIGTYDCMKKNKGVMREEYMNVVFVDEQKDKTTDMLMFSHPCVCGSMNHISSNHTDCLLNMKYSDAIEC